MSVDKIHRNKVLIRMKYSKRLVAAKLDVITMVIVPLFISHPREWWRNETSCAIERSFIRVEIKFLVSQPYRYIDCVEFLSKVRLRLIRPGSEILSRLFSFFFFFVWKIQPRIIFPFFLFLSHSQFFQCYRDTSAFSRPDTWQIESEQWKSRNFRFRLWCNLFRNKRIVQFFRLEGILIVCLSLLRATIVIVCLIF